MAVFYSLSLSLSLSQLFTIYSSDPAARRHTLLCIMHYYCWVTKQNKWEVKYLVVIIETILIVFQQAGMFYVFASRPFRQGVVRVIQSIFVCDISTIPLITLDHTVSCHGEVEREWWGDY